MPAYTPWRSRPRRRANDQRGGQELGHFPYLPLPGHRRESSSIRTMGGKGNKALLWRQVIWRIMRTSGVIRFGVGISHLNIGGGAIP